jgi:hypothetical protein
MSWSRVRKLNASSESMGPSAASNRGNQIADEHRAQARRLDTFFVAIACRIYHNGLPRTQGELARSTPVSTPARPSQPCGNL